MNWKKSIEKTLYLQYIAMKYKVAIIAAAQSDKES